MDHTILTDADILVKKFQADAKNPRHYTKAGAVLEILQSNSGPSEYGGELEHMQRRLELLESLVANMIAKELNNMQQLNSLADCPHEYNQFVKLEE